MSRVLSDFNEENVLGKGSFGCALRVLCKIDETRYALKKVVLKDDSKESFESARREVLGMAQLCHTNIVRYHTAWLEDEKAGLFRESGSSEDSEDSEERKGPMLCIQQELCYGSLEDVLETLKNEGSVLEEKKAWSYFNQLVSGVDHIHSKGIIHGDLSPGNIFFDETRSVVKIGDFGFVSLDGERELQDGEYPPQTSYVAPELTQKPRKLSLSSDIYSLGIILFEMLSGATTKQEWYDMLRNLKKRNELPDSIKDDAKYWIIEMTHADPRTRCTAKTIIDSGNW